MASERFENLRLTLMQDLLPVGLAVFKRAKEGGAKDLLEVFSESSNPLEELREEGESSARSLRQKLDQVSPGLGNPVMSVNVDVEDISVESIQLQDEEELIEILTRIESNLDSLNNYLSNSKDDSSSSVLN